GGPAHLNAPFREPLAPVPGPLPEVRNEPAVHHVSARGMPDVRELAGILSRHPRGVIVCGPRDARDDFPAAVRELSRALGYAVLTEATTEATVLATTRLLPLRPGGCAARPRPGAIEGRDGTRRSRYPVPPPSGDSPQGDLPVPSRPPLPLRGLRSFPGVAA